MRIVSLVPSITETLFDFGLDGSEIVGRTKFCIHPSDKVKEVAVIGGTKNLNLEKIRALQPDLIIANKEENDRDQVLELEKDFKVWLTDIKTLEDNHAFLAELGQVINRPDKAIYYNNKIAEIFTTLIAVKPMKTAYLIWEKPYMTVGGDTFIHDILKRLGFNNIFEEHKRYPVIEISALSDAEVILLSSEPYPFREKHIGQLQARLPNARIILVDGEAFSWYGTHLMKCGPYFQSLSITGERPEV